MTKGAKQARGFGSLGLQVSQTLGGRLVGGGVQDNLRRVMGRQTPTGSMIAAIGASGGLTYIEGTGETSPVVPLPVDAATITDGLWIVQGQAQVSVNPGDDVGISARLLTSSLSPISDWFYSGVGPDGATVIVPAHFAVFGNSDAVRLEFAQYDATGPITSIGGTITGYLVGS